jgi:3-oxoacyl-[acyl-carrier-protein] synthase-3
MPSGLSDIAYELGSINEGNLILGAAHPGWDMDAIFERSGVLNRVISENSQTALDLAERAVYSLFHKISINVSELDGLIFCTQTPDFLLPGNSSLLHGRLGLGEEVMSFDITHACSGFIYASAIASSLVKSGAASNVLVVTGDTYSRLIHPEDKSARPIFGDGAAAVIVSKRNYLWRIVDSKLYSSGKHSDRFMIKHGGAKYPRKLNSVSNSVIHEKTILNRHEYVLMDGFGVLSFFTSVVPKAVTKILKNNNTDYDEISYFIFHQASKLGLDSLQKLLNIPAKKMILEIEDTGNLVSASIPICLARLKEKYDLNLKHGDKVLLCGFGVGLSWGVMLVEYVGG